MLSFKQLFTYFWLPWVFSCSQLELLFLQSFRPLGARSSVVVVHRPNCLGNFPDEGLNPCPPLADRLLIAGPLRKSILLVLLKDTLASLIYKHELMLELCIRLKKSVFSEVSFPCLV